MPGVLNNKNNKFMKTLQKMIGTYELDSYPVNKFTAMIVPVSLIKCSLILTLFFSTIHVTAQLQNCTVSCTMTVPSLPVQPAPTVVGNPGKIIFSAIAPGDGYTFTNMLSSETYRLSTCGGSSDDTQLLIYFGNSLVDCNSDGCGQ